MNRKTSFFSRPRGVSAKIGKSYKLKMCKLKEHFCRVEEACFVFWHPPRIINKRQASLACLRWHWKFDACAHRVFDKRVFLILALQRHRITHSKLGGLFPKQKVESRWTVWMDDFSICAPGTITLKVKDYDAQTWAALSKTKRSMIENDPVLGSRDEPDWKLPVGRARISYEWQNSVFLFTRHAGEVCLCGKRSQSFLSC